jgi:hypothetical protein
MNFFSDSKAKDRNSNSREQKTIDDMLEIFTTNGGSQTHPDTNQGE